MDAGTPTLKEITDQKVVFFTGFQYDMSNIGHWDGKSIALADSPYIYSAACILGVAPVPVSGQGVLVLTLSNLYVFLKAVYGCDDCKLSKIISAEKSKAYKEALIACDLSLVFDNYVEMNFTHSLPSEDPRKDSYGFGQMTFRGELPEEGQRIVLSRRPVQSAYRLWRNNFFISSDHKAKLQYGAAKNLLMSLMLDYRDAAPVLPEMDDDAVQIVRQLFSFLEVTNISESEQMRELCSIYQFYDDLAKCWEYVASRSRLCLELSRRDLRSPATCQEALSEYGRALGMDSYVDALVSGVPLEDILA